MSFSNNEENLTNTSVTYQDFDDVFDSDPSDRIAESALLSENDVNEILKSVSRAYYNQRLSSKTQVDPDVFRQVYVSFYQPDATNLYSSWSVDTKLRNLMTSRRVNKYLILNVKSFFPITYKGDLTVGHFILIVIHYNIAYVYPLYPIIVKELNDWLTEKLELLGVVYDYSVQQDNRSQSCGWYCVQTIVELEEGTRELPKVFSTGLLNPRDKDGKIKPIEII